MQNREIRFTQRASHIFRLSQAEAERLKHSWIGTEHLLVALGQEPEGIAGQVLLASGLDVQQIQAAVEQIMPPGKHVLDRIDLTPDLRKTLQMATDEARRMGHPYIGTEHLLLALLRQTRTPGSRVLDRLKVNRDEMRRQVLALIQTNLPVPTPTSGGSQIQTTSASESEIPVGIYIWVKMRDTEAHTRYYDAHPTRSSRLRALFGLAPAAQADELDKLPPS